MMSAVAWSRSYSAISSIGEAPRGSTRHQRRSTCDTLRWWGLWRAQPLFRGHGHPLARGRRGFDSTMGSRAGLDVGHDGSVRDRRPRHGEHSRWSDAGRAGRGKQLRGRISRASGAAACTFELRREWSDSSWPFSVRMALHTGELQTTRCRQLRGSDDHPLRVLHAIAHGGQVVLSQATRDLVADDLPSGAWLDDMGVHSLKDLDRPQHVSQLRHPDLSLNATPLVSSGAPPSNNLPTQLTSFVGRTREIATVLELMHTNRMVTLLGTGGAGKTRLSLRVAEETTDRHPDGVWFVDLSRSRIQASCRRQSRRRWAYGSKAGVGSMRRSRHRYSTAMRSSSSTTASTSCRRRRRLPRRFSRRVRRSRSWRRHARPSESPANSPSPCPAWTPMVRPPCSSQSERPSSDPGLRYRSRTAPRSPRSVDASTGCLLRSSLLRRE